MLVDSAAGVRQVDDLDQISYQPKLFARVLANEMAIRDVVDNTDVRVTVALDHAQ